MTLDREVYFPGEVVRLTMKAVNPTAQIMEVFDLFHSYCIDEMEKSGGGYAPFSPYPRVERGPCWSTQTVWLARNRELRYESRSREFQARGLGEYRLHLEAWAPANADYRVVEPVAENYAFTEISTDEKFASFKRYVFAAVLSWGSERFLVVTDEVSTQLPRLTTKPTGSDNDMVGQIGPYVRVRQLGEPVSDLQAHADREDTVELRWRSASGTWQGVKLPDRGRMTAYEVLHRRLR